jgi:hypothetical protein
MHSSPVSCHLIPLRCKYSPQHSTLFSNTVSLCCSFNVRDQVSRPYRNITLRILISILYIRMCHYVLKSFLTGFNQCAACLTSQFTKRTHSTLKVSIRFENKIESKPVSILTTSYLKTEVQSTFETSCIVSMSYLMQ